MCERKPAQPLFSFQVLLVTCTEHYLQPCLYVYLDFNTAGCSLSCYHNGSLACQTNFSRAHIAKSTSGDGCQRSVSQWNVIIAERHVMECNYYEKSRLNYSPAATFRAVMALTWSFIKAMRGLTITTTEFRTFRNSLNTAGSRQ